MLRTHLSYLCNSGQFKNGIDAKDSVVEKKSFAKFVAIVQRAEAPPGRPAPFTVISFVVSSSYRVVEVVIVVSSKSSCPKAVRRAGCVGSVGWRVVGMGGIGVIRQAEIGIGQQWVDGTRHLRYRRGKLSWCRGHRHGDLRRNNLLLCREKL